MKRTYQPHNRRRLRTHGFRRRGPERPSWCGKPPGTRISRRCPPSSFPRSNEVGGKRGSLPCAGKRHPDRSPQGIPAPGIPVPRKLLPILSELLGVHHRLPSVERRAAEHPGRDAADRAVPPLSSGGGGGTEAHPHLRHEVSMEKRMILAIVLSIIILLAYQRLFAPEPSQAPPPAHRQGGAKAGSGDNAAGAAGAPALAVPPSPASEGLIPGRENPLRWIPVRTPLYIATVTTAGGGIQSFTLSRYNDRTGPKGKPLDIIGSGALRPLPLDLHLAAGPPAFPPQPVFASTAPGELSVAAGGKKTVSLSWESAGGGRITPGDTFTGGGYDFEVDQKVT